MSELLLFPKQAGPPRDTRVRDDTPYWKFPDQGPAERNRDPLLLALVSAAPVVRIFEAFGGLGFITRILTERFPEASIDSFDLDPECCRRYNALGLARAYCHQGDALEGLKGQDWPSGDWGASLDYNKFTILDLDRSEGKWKRELLFAVAERRPAWVQLTDSAVCHLSLNWSRYGLADKTLPLYLEQLVVRLGRPWKLQAYAARRTHCYTLLTCC